jgi:hypothetical protein
MESRLNKNINEMNNDMKEGTVFKYREINKNTYQLLINREIWFSKPNTFNDPFECNINVEFGENLEL